MQQEREATYAPVTRAAVKDVWSYSASIHSSRRPNDTIFITEACLFTVRILRNKGQNICLCKSVVCTGDFVNSGDYDPEQCSIYIIYMVYTRSESF
jgi:hypothetical protein